jgi:hypothetical protein
MGRRDARRDELCRAVEVRGQHPWAAHRVRLRESDAWDGVRQDAMADARRELRQKLDEGAGKSAGRGRDGPASDGSQSDVPVQLTAKMRWTLAVAALCKWGAGRSAA